MYVAASARSAPARRQVEPVERARARSARERFDIGAYAGSSTAQRSTGSSASDASPFRPMPALSGVVTQDLFGRAENSASEESLLRASRAYRQAEELRMRKAPWLREVA